MLQSRIKCLSCKCNIKALTFNWLRVPCKVGKAKVKISQLKSTNFSISLMMSSAADSECVRALVELSMTK